LLFASSKGLKAVPFRITDLVLSLLNFKSNPVLVVFKVKRPLLCTFGVVTCVVAVAVAKVGVVAALELELTAILAQ
jgi:hypothetical protein